MRADGPIRSWLVDLAGWASATLPRVFLLVVLVVGAIIMIRKGNKKKGIPGGVAAAVAFGLGAALVLLLLRNVPAVADLFGRELPRPGQ